MYLLNYLVSKMDNEVTMENDMHKIKIKGLFWTWNCDANFLFYCYNMFINAYEDDFEYKTNFIEFG